MNPASPRIRTRLLGVLGAALLAAPVGAGDETRQLVVVHGDDDGVGSFSGSHTVEVSIENGDVTVRLDGEEVPHGRVLREDGAIIILDKNGNKVRTIEVPSAGKFGGLDFQFGDGTGRFRFAPGPDAGFQEPPVMLGIHLGVTSPALNRHLKLEPGTTTMITALYEDLAAHDAGLGLFDIITAIDGEEPADPASLRAALAEHEPGDLIRFTVIQEGRSRHVSVTLAPFDREAMAEAKLIGAAPRIAVGVGLGGEDGVGPFGSFRFFGDGRDFTHQDLEDVFVDDKNRVFELFRDPRVRILTRPGSADEDGDDEAFGGDRFRTLDRRLQGLEEMLDALLKEVKEKGDR